MEIIDNFIQEFSKLSFLNQTIYFVGLLVFISLICVFLYYIIDFIGDLFVMRKEYIDNGRSFQKRAKQQKIHKRKKE